MAPQTLEQWRTRDLAGRAVRDLPGRAFRSFAGRAVLSPAARMHRDSPGHPLRDSARRALRAVVAVSLFLAGIACSSGAKLPLVDGDADAANDVGDVGPVALTCQAIRLCVAAGASAETCAAKGSVEAQTAFQALLDCLAAPCPGLVPACVCQEECQQPDGFCLDQTDACMAASGTTVDAVCGQYCGG